MKNEIANIKSLSDEQIRKITGQDEGLQSYMMWFARMEGLPYEITDGETRVCSD
jgi:hypothetical protein